MEYLGKAVAIMRQIIRCVERKSRPLDQHYGPGYNFHNPVKETHWCVRDSSGFILWDHRETSLEGIFVSVLQGWREGGGGVADGEMG